MAKINQPIKSSQNSIRSDDTKTRRQKNYIFKKIFHKIFFISEERKNFVIIFRYQKKLFAPTSTWKKFLFSRFRKKKLKKKLIFLFRKIFGIFFRHLRRVPKKINDQQKFLKFKNIFMKYKHVTSCTWLKFDTEESKLCFTWFVRDFKAWKIPVF